MENKLTAKSLIKIIALSIVIAIAIIALLLFIFVQIAIKKYNEAAEARRKPISDPETYAEFVYVKPTYEKYKEYIGFHEIAVEGGGIISYRVTINDSADKALWLDIVSGFADDIENSGQLIEMIFYDSDYTKGPYCFKISNCTYINDSGQVRYFDGDKVCYLSFDDDYGEYNVLDIIESLNVENIQINSAAISDKQAFADTLKKTDIKRLSVSCYNYVDDAEEWFAEFQQEMNELLPDNIQVWFSLYS